MVIDSSENSSPAVEVDGRRQRIWTAMFLAVVALIPVLFVSLHVSKYTKISPVDELQHIDYLYKVPALVASGDLVGQEAMHAEACRGIDAAFTPPPCSDTAVYDPKDFQEDGYNTASINTPIYYAVTRILSAPIMALTPANDLVTAARLTGAIFLGLGLAVTYFVGRRLGAPRTGLLATLAILAATPSLLFPSATISPDALVLLVGATMAWCVLWWEESPRKRWWVLALASGLAVLIKLTNIVVVAAAGIYVLYRLIETTRASRRGAAEASKQDSDREKVKGLAWGTGAIAATTAVCVLGWMAVQRLIAHGDPLAIPMTARFRVTEFPFGEVVSTFGELLNPLSTPNVWVGNNSLVNVTQRASSFLFASAVIAGALFVTRLPKITVLSRCWVAAALLSGVGFIVISYVGQGVYVPPPARYSATLIPMMAVIVARLGDSRFTKVVLVILATLMSVLTLIRLLMI